MTSIEDLARMVQKGFEESSKQVNNLEKWTTIRFDNVDTQLKDIRKQLTGIVYRYEFDGLEARVKDLESLLAINTLNYEMEKALVLGTGPFFAFLQKMDLSLNLP
jgi:hypothetical protein